MFPILLGAAILALAALILIRRLAAFFRTRGCSACDHCPYGACNRSHSQSLPR